MNACFAQESTRTYVSTSVKNSTHLNAGRPPFKSIFLYFLPFFFFFPFVTEKDGKDCFNAKKNYFNQQTAGKATACWSKYTTCGAYKSLNKSPGCLTILFRYLSRATHRLPMTCKKFTFFVSFRLTRRV